MGRLRMSSSGADVWLECCKQHLCTRVVWPFSQWTELENFSSSFAFGTWGFEVTKYKERQNSRFGITTYPFINKTVDLKLLCVSGA